MNRRRYLALPTAATRSLGGWGKVSSPGEQDASPGGAHHRTPKAGKHKPQHSAALTGLEQGNTHCSSGSRAQSVPGVSTGRAAWLPDSTPTAARLSVVSQGVFPSLPLLSGAPFLPYRHTGLLSLNGRRSTWLPAFPSSSRVPRPGLSRALCLGRRAARSGQCRSLTACAVKLALPYGREGEFTHTK